MTFIKPAGVMTMILLIFLCSTFCYASGETGTDEATEISKSEISKGFLAIAAALSVGLCAIATAIAQSRIGAAGCGALAEKPELTGTIILLVAIPETMVILGFVVAVVILFI